MQNQIKDSQSSLFNLNKQIGSRQANFDSQLCKPSSQKTQQTVSFGQNRQNQTSNNTSRMVMSAQKHMFNSSISQIPSSGNQFKQMLPAQPPSLRAQPSMITSSFAKTPISMNISRQTSTMFGAIHSNFQNRGQRSKNLMVMNAEPNGKSSTNGINPTMYGWGSLSDSSTRVSTGRDSVVMQAALAENSSMVPDMAKRSLMNYILLGSVAGSLGCLGGPFLYYFYPATSGGGGGGLTAKYKNGDDVTLKSWMSSHKEGDRELVQGLKGDATYLITEKDGVKDFGINAVCTHLGCVVPWNKAENKYMCPCHGSQYNPQGKVIRGPAPLSLAIAHITVDEGDKIVFTTWTEQDFRTGLKPWWS